MKTSLICVICILYLSFISPNNKILLEKFRIGNSYYFIYNENKYLHDDDAYAKYYVVYKQGQSKEDCSAFLSLKKNGQAIIKGNYNHNNSYLEFKEYYFGKRWIPADSSWMPADSSIKIFYPNKKGHLILTEVIDYTNGVAKKTNY